MDSGHRSTPPFVVSVFERSVGRWRFLRAILAAALALALALVAEGAAAADPVYETDFGAGVGPEWSSNLGTTSPDGESFHGRFDEDDATTLNLAGLPAHDRLIVEFDIYVIDSMDGNDTGPGSGEEEDGVSHPDIFRFSADGALVKQTTFGNRHPQAFPGDYPGDSNPPKTGATEEENLGYGEETTFRVLLTFPHSAASLAFEAAGIGLEDIGDESWGLDNVKVSAESSPPSAAPVPIGQPKGNPSAYKKCVAKAKRAHRKALRRAKLLNRKARKATRGRAKRQIGKRVRRIRKRAAKARRARLKACRAKYL